MTKIYIYICDLCRMEGKKRKGKHTYTAEDGDDYDICDNCLTKVKGYGTMPTWENVLKDEDWQEQD